MILPALASVDELVARLGTSLSGEEWSRAQAALDAASGLIRAEARRDFVAESGMLDFGLAAWAVQVIETVTLNVAERVMRNPDGTSQTSVGDVSVSYSRDGTAGSAYLTPADRRDIRRALGASSVQSVVLETPYMGEEIDPELISLMGGS